MGFAGAVLQNCIEQQFRVNHVKSFYAMDVCAFLAYLKEPGSESDHSRVSNTKIHNTGLFISPSGISELAAQQPRQTRQKGAYQ